MKGAAVRSHGCPPTLWRRKAGPSAAEQGRFAVLSVIWIAVVVTVATPPSQAAASALVGGSAGEFLDPDVYVVRARLIGRGLKHVSEQHPHDTLAPGHKLRQFDFYGTVAADLDAKESFTGGEAAASPWSVLEDEAEPAAESASSAKARAAKLTEAHAEGSVVNATVARQETAVQEPAEWAEHFRLRRLQQAGGAGIAAAPSTSRLLRRASRDTPTAAPAGGVGIDAEADASAQANANLFSSLADAPAANLAQRGQCNTLAYQGGYASFAVEPYATFRFTTNMEQCCELCEQDESCQAWSRSAGGQASVRSCHLMGAVNASSVASQPPAQGAALPPPAAGSGTLSLAAVSFTAGTSPQIVESGTKSDAAADALLPSQFYGCPYPPDVSGNCVAPRYCNCYGGVCYGSCRGNDLLDAINERMGSGAAAPL